MCNHNNIQYCIRNFADGSEHFCIQCKDCGRVVPMGKKTWLKLDDIPMEEEIVPFDHDLNTGGYDGNKQGGLF